MLAVLYRVGTRRCRISSGGEVVCWQCSVVAAFDQGVQDQQISSPKKTPKREPSASIGLIVPDSSVCAAQMTAKHCQ